MTQEDLKYLKQFEPNFKTAIKSNYTRNIVKSNLENMLNIYQKETGTKYNLCYHCPTSVLKFIQTVGKFYFNLVQDGNEPTLKTKELQNTVTKKENKKEKTNKEKCQTQNKPNVEKGKE